MPSNWTELLVRSRIADLRREAEHERQANHAHHQWHGPAVRRARSVRKWLRAGVADVVRALLRRPATCEAPYLLRAEPRSREWCLVAGPIRDPGGQGSG